MVLWNHWGRDILQDMGTALTNDNIVFFDNIQIDEKTDMVFLSSVLDKFKDVTYVIPNHGSIQLGELLALLRVLVEC